MRRPSGDQSSSETPLRYGRSSPPIVGPARPPPPTPPPPPSGTRLQRVTSDPSGEKQIVRVAGFLSSRTPPLVRLRTSPVPTWLTPRSHGPPRPDSKAAAFD